MTQLNGTNGKERIKKVVMSWVANPQSGLLIEGATLQDINPLEIKVVNTTTTRTSEITKYIIEGIAEVQSNGGGEIKIPLEEMGIVLKHYLPGEIKDTANRRSERERISLEGAVLTCLGQHTKRVPRILAYTDQEIWMTNLGGDILSNRIDKLDGESLRVLEFVVKNGMIGTFQDQLVETLGWNAIDIVRDLEGRGLLYRESGKLLVTTRYGDIYTLDEEGQLQEKNELQEERNLLVMKGVEALLEVQKVGNQAAEEIQRAGIVQQSLQDAIADDMKYIEGTLRYGKRILSERENEKVIKTVKKLNECLYGFPEELRTNFIQGDGYSENLVTRFGDIFVLDFFHAGQGIWISDIVDLVNYAHLFSGIEDTDKIYERALEQRSEFTQNPTVFKQYQKEIVYAMTMKRALRTLGTISWILSGEGNYIQAHHHERNMLKHQRTAYASLLKKQLSERRSLRRLAELIET